MAEDTIITVVGNAVEDAELRFTPSGAAVTSFRLASTPRQFDKATNAWKDLEPNFFTIKVWRQPAENVAETVTKGTRLVVTGRLRLRQYENKQGEKRLAVEIEADEVGVSLKFATATVKKMSRPSAGAPAGDQWSNAAPAPSFSDEPPF